MGNVKRFPQCMLWVERPARTWGSRDPKRTIPLCRDGSCGLPRGPGGGARGAGRAPVTCADWGSRWRVGSDSLRCLARPPPGCSPQAPPPRCCSAANEVLPTPGEPLTSRPAANAPPFGRQRAGPSGTENGMSGIAVPSVSPASPLHAYPHLRLYPTPRKLSPLESRR